MNSQFSGPIRTDLVISMTLAETFLLLVFVVWYGVTPHSRAKNDDTTPPEVQIARLQARVAVLESENAKLKSNLEKAQTALDWWRTQFPQAIPWEGTRMGPGEVKNVICGSGRPPCQRDDNVLVTGSVVNGGVSVKIMTECPALTTSMGDWGASHLQRGTVLTNPADLQEFFEGVRRYRINLNGKESECRFSYRFSYCNYKDYFDGRELFEKYFYGAGRAQTTCSAK